MSEIFSSHRDLGVPNPENAWQHDLAAQHPDWSDHRQGGLPYDGRYPLEDTTLPADFEEITEIREINKTTPEPQVDFPDSTDDKQTTPLQSGMSDEEVERARKHVASMFSGSSSEQPKSPKTEIVSQPEIQRKLEQQFTIPRGWTTLIHGTDSSRWQVGEREKVVQGFYGLSVITAEDRARNRADAIRMGNPNAFDTTASYTRSSSHSTDAAPVEARILFYKEAMSPRIRASEDIADLKAALPAEISQLIRNYYQSRHPVVPRGETLVYMGGGTDEESGRVIEYFIPASVAEAYKTAVDAENEHATSS